ncbi:SH3 domain-containing protein [Chloroflexales bacterium ZM16-3]|nr:SH3 domain-containing protein [Chloroflexales bacterium ZM16-3]
MLRFWPPPLRRCCLAAVAVVAALGIVACGDLTAALPPRPTPFPTLERLPSVTPVTPSPSPLPTATPTATPAVSPTPDLPRALIVVDANMRSGPGLGFDIVTVVRVGSSIALSERQGEWYAVRTADGLEGWMSDQVLDLDPSVADRVPQSKP